MKKSELRQIIREEIIEESAALEIVYLTNALRNFKKTGDIEQTVARIGKSLDIEYNTRALRRLKSILAGLVPSIENANKKVLKKLAVNILDSGIKFYW